MLRASCQPVLRRTAGRELLAEYPAPFLRDDASHDVGAAALRKADDYAQGFHRIGLCHCRQRTGEQCGQQHAGTGRLLHGVSPAIAESSTVACRVCGLLQGIDALLPRHGAEIRGLSLL